ncbi:hypothetical protein JJB07_14555 [Tumebacillus sp. ITR2]|uniref:HTH cro/C1-type domain-containing protein n=1 Tax=Tumebacillus amylolyticus TaxID=2801339 RepID=A0ABS1JCU5_9BACL|nr:hypothetical protein [Tumebacillus amylolyticus]MBL0387859.1 hypothetical protein [Tumebacillus amylolyticus]
MDGVAFGRRVKEIIEDLVEMAKEDGQKALIEEYVQSIADEIRMSTRTVKSILAGDRPVTKISEQELIAKAIGLPLARILQLDTCNLLERLETLLKADCTEEEIAEALAKANTLYKRAVGRTERCICLNHLGRAQFKAGFTNDAHVTWKEAFDLAVKLANPDLTFKICNNLMITSLRKRRYSDFEKVLDQAEPLLEGDQERIGRLYYFRARVAIQCDEIREAKEHLLASMDHLTMTSDRFMIGDAQHNLAEYELRYGSQEKAIEYFEEAVHNLESAPIFQKLMTTQAYADALYKIGNIIKARQIALESIELMGPYPYHDIKAQFMMLISRIDNNPEAAEKAFFLKVGTDVKLQLSEFLLDFYLRVGDASKALYYHEVMLELKDYNRR